jgi:hypothetical protein
MGIARGAGAMAGFSHGSKRELWITVSDFLLKWELTCGSGQAAEPPAVGRTREIE